MPISMSIAMLSGRPRPRSRRHYCPSCARCRYRGDSEVSAAAMSPTRRLAAILAADVAGYSRLIEADEEGTLGRLRVLRAEVIDPKIAGHKGRIVKTTGDGLLVEFASVVDAVRCAAEVQAAMAECNAR